MLPDWMRSTDNYVPPKDGGTFIVKTLIALGNTMSRLKLQAGHEPPRALPAMVKLLLLFVLILTTSLTQNRLVLLLVGAVLLTCLSTWPPEDILDIVKNAFIAGGIALLLFGPSMLMNPAGVMNNVRVIAKVLLCVTMVNIFNHTTQWNHITTALRKLHIPGVFVFTLDITLKYIVLLGNLIRDLLTSMLLRSVGKHNKKYSSVGGVMGVTFLRGTEMSAQMYEAMVCRGFTDDYNAGREPVWRDA